MNSKWDEFETNKNDQGNEFHVQRGSYQFDV